MRLDLGLAGSSGECLIAVQINKVWLERGKPSVQNTSCGVGMWNDIVKLASEVLGEESGI